MLTKYKCAVAEGSGNMTEFKVAEASDNGPKLVLRQNLTY